ncbi:MAG: glycosyltransferase family 87 protein [Myxococcota bacterium]|nr:glycosyltransferase family 87 protein [Myxococcota bacterium]
MSEAETAGSEREAGSEARPAGGGVWAWVAWAWIAALLWLFVSSLPATQVVRENDLPAYYNAGLLVASERTDLLYGDTFRPRHNRFTNLPIIAPLFVPLAKLDYASAWQLFWWLQVLSFAATAAVLLFAVHRHLSPLTPARAAVLLTIWAAFIPTLHRCLVLGQSTPMLVFVFALFYLACRYGRKGLGGVLLGVVCLMKIPPMLLLPLLAARRRMTTAGIAFSMWLAAVVLSALVFGPDTLTRFAQTVIFDNAGGAIATFNNQSLDGAWMRLLSDKGLTDWKPTPRPFLVSLADLASIVVLAVVLLRSGRTLLWPREVPDDSDPTRGSLEVELLIGVLVMVLVFPVVWIHYYLFAMVPLALVPFWIERQGLPHARWRIASYAIGVLCVGCVAVYGNVYYEAREGEAGFRALQNLRPLGALLLLATVLPAIGAAARGGSANDARADGVC